MAGECFVTLIAGPTASGKSARALRLAMQERAVIVNADSMQVYSDLRILSARPSIVEEQAVEHRLFGFVPSEVEFSVGRYIEAVASLLHDARTSGRRLVIVGGTGLYMRALTEGLMPTPEIPADIRSFWRERAAAGHDLYAELASRDPQRAAMLAPADTPRLLRAIELHAATGRSYSEWMSANPGQPLLAAGEWAGTYIQPDPAWLKARIDQRFMTMIAEGAIDEVRLLLARQPALSPNLGVMKAHGVPHLSAHIRGALSLDGAIERGQQDTRAYARRQGVFARRYFTGPGWTWIDSADAE